MDLSRDQTRFEDHYGLSRLPWFEIRDGRLALRDRTLGPIVDVHTHLALSYVRRTTVDLEAAPGPTQHYLPMARPLDLDVYCNRNIPPADLKRLMRDLSIASVTTSGMRVTHTVPNLLREMREVGVTASLLLPIDFPALSYNAAAYLEVAAAHRELPALGSVHPYAPDVAGKLDAQQAAGARGVKVHPAAQLMAPDNERAMRLYRLCAERRLPVLFHCGPVGIENVYSRYLCRLRHYRRAVAENRDVTFVLGHSGALEMEQALALCCEFDNVCLEVSCQAVSNVRRIVQEAPPDRIMFGSDWPFYHQSIPLAKVLLATEDRRELRPGIFWQNAARVFRLELPDPS
ncbi:MAG: amidohydrolase family protein [Deltaproteobacteria bacterium]|nr:amidohydrolase family protein [Deltaproteobacteria bacterium]